MKKQPGKKEAQAKSKDYLKGKRYSPQLRRQILLDAESDGVKASAQKHGVSEATIYVWRRSPIPEASGPSEPSEVSDPQEVRDDAILDMWKRYPGYGPSQIKNMLRRNSIRASVGTVRRVMEEGGYIAPKMKPREKVARYEAGRPRELYHLDFYHFHVHKQKQCLMLMQDDYSRFIVGWKLCSSERADPVIESFEKAVQRYGKPEGVMSDRGSAFHSWKGVSRFQKTLEEYEVNFFLAKEARTNGKVEALNAAFQKECLRQREFMSLADTQNAVALWVERYNHQRTHHSLGGVLVPADRFYGLEERTMQLIEVGEGASALELLNPAYRSLELFKIVSDQGETQVYLMGKKILG